MYGRAFTWRHECGQLHGTYWWTTNRFFYNQNAHTSPEVMKPKKKKLYCQVFGVSEDSTFSFCSSCCEYFAAMPWVLHIDNSNKTLREKVANICSHLPGVPDWIFPDENEQLELDDFNSDGSLFGQISVPVWSCWPQSFSSFSKKPAATYAVCHTCFFEEFGSTNHSGKFYRLLMRIELKTLLASKIHWTTLWLKWRKWGLLPVSSMCQCLRQQSKDLIN